MAPSAFLDRDSLPGDRELVGVLGTAASLWTRLRANLAAEYPPLSEKWSYSGKSHGWLLQLKQRKTTVLYLVPGRGFFVASFALSERAWAAARTGGLPASVAALLETAPKYSEGRGVRLEVREKADLAAVEKLAAIKISAMM